MSEKLILMAGAAVVALLVSGEAKAGTLFSVTGIGTVSCGTLPVSEGPTLSDCGTDGLGLFGASGSSLIGDSFTMVMTFDTDSAVSPPYSSETEYNLYAYGMTSVTINGQTFTFASGGPLMLDDSLSVDGSGGNQCPINLPTPGDESEISSANCDLIWGSTEGSDSDSGAELLVWSFADDFFADSTVLQDISHGIAVDDGVEFYFGTCNDDVCTNFGDPLNSITLNVTGVPEPASLSLFGSALAWFGLKRRRRRR